MTPRARVLFACGFLFVCCACLLLPDLAVAAGERGVMLNDISDEFRKTAAEWAKALLDPAERLFWVLTWISLVYTTGMFLYKGSSFADFYGHFLRFLIVTGFFFWVLTKSTELFPAIINSGLKLATDATGTGLGDPSSVMDLAFETADGIFKAASNLKGIDNVPNSLLLYIIGFVILIILALVAANLTIELCAAWIVLYGGLFALGFAGSDWTRETALGYYKAVLGSALRLMAMYLLIGLGASIMTKAKGRITSASEIQQVAELLIYALILLAVMNKIPNLISGMVGVGAGHSAGGLGLGAAMGAGALAYGAATATVGAAQSLASAAQGAWSAGSGAASAIKNAFSKADSSGGGSSSFSGASGDSAGGLSAALGSPESSYATPSGDSGGSGNGGGSSGSSGGGGGGGAAPASSPAPASGTSSTGQSSASDKSGGDDKSKDKDKGTSGSERMMDGLKMMSQASQDINRELEK
jgi:P-type conjugative transfer protein TrbL